MEVRTTQAGANLEREGFAETSDPALQPSADRGAAKLLGYTELYELWERQQWRTQDLDFSRDREDWQNFSDEERFLRMYGLCGFFIGEQKVADELGPMMRAAPREEQRIFLGTQIADEARHVRFFDRFYSEVGVFDGTGDLSERLEAASAHLNPSFSTLFDELLGSRVSRLGSEPEDTETLVEAVTLYHMVIEGVLALTGQHFILATNEARGTLPGFVEGFQNVARDEHRHIAFGVRFLAEMADAEPRYKAAIERMLAEALPVASGVLDPPWADDPDVDWDILGATQEETHAFAGQCLQRRLKVIGLA
jgi:ribonucleoside-diphosphate reductase beta chain